MNRRTCTNTFMKTNTWTPPHPPVPHARTGGRPLSRPRRRTCHGLLALLSAALAGAAPASASIFTVTTADEAGPGSLRQAILDANAQPGLDEIRFAIPGAGVQTIQPLTPAPIITDPVHIDGYTQPGSAPATATSPATLLIELSGALLPGGPGVNGITLGPGSSGSSIRGLSIHRFARVVGGTGHAILLLGSGGHWIAGNHLNVAPDGRTIFTGTPGVGDGVDDNGTGGNLIGHDPAGPNRSNPAADRNIISGAGPGRVGLLVLPSASHNQVRGNYLGTDATGSLALGNGADGVQLQSPGNLVEGNLISGNGRLGAGCYFAGGNVVRDNLIGTDASGTLRLGNAADGIFLISPGNHVENNLISANGGGGVWMSTAPSNTLAGNRIGTDVTGTLALGNHSSGIYFLPGHNRIRDNLISANGGAGIFMSFSSSNAVTGNKIGTDISGRLALGNQGDAGVLIEDGSGGNLIGGLAQGDGNTIAFNPAGVVVVRSSGNTLLGNSIFSNVGLGIDLDGDGVTPNGTSPVEDSANHLQPFPVLDGRQSFLNPALVQVFGSLDSRPGQTCLVQVFSSALADPSGHGEGQQLVGHVVVTTDRTGHAAFHVPARLQAAPGTILSATATDLLTGDTSEFSPWQNVARKGSPTAYEQAAGARAPRADRLGKPTAKAALRPLDAPPASH